MQSHDMATRREEEHRDRALLNQRLRALGMPASRAGVCANCDDECLPLAVYCDPDCRTDHEARLKARSAWLGGHRP